MIIRYGYRKRIDEILEYEQMHEINDVYNVTVFYSKETNQYIIEYATKGEGIFNDKTLILGYNDFFAFIDENIKR